MQPKKLGNGFCRVRSGAACKVKEMKWIEGYLWGSRVDLNYVLKDT